MAFDLSVPFTDATIFQTPDPVDIRSPASGAGQRKAPLPLFGISMDMSNIPEASAGSKIAPQLVSGASLTAGKSMSEGKAPMMLTINSDFGAKQFVIDTARNTAVEVTGAGLKLAANQRQRAQRNATFGGR